MRSLRNGGDGDEENDMETIKDFLQRARERELRNGAWEEMRGD